MRKPIITCIILANLIACNDNVAEDVRLQSYSIDTNRITVSGLSSGGYMAGQLHLAHSSLFRGVAILAGGPYWCAEGSLSKGLGPCVAGDLRNRFVVGRHDDPVKATTLNGSFYRPFDDWLAAKTADVLARDPFAAATGRDDGESHASTALVSAAKTWSCCSSVIVGYIGRLTASV